MTPEQQDKIRKKIELIRTKVRHIFDLLEEIEKEMEHGRLERGYNSDKSSGYSNTTDTGISGEEKT